MFRAARYSSSGGPIVSPQPLVSSPSVRLLTEGDDTRGCGDTIGPPDDEQRAAQNMLRRVVYHMYCWRLKELCTKLVFWKVYLPYCFTNIFTSCCVSPACLVILFDVLQKRVIILCCVSKTSLVILLLCFRNMFIILLLSFGNTFSMLLCVRSLSETCLSVFRFMWPCIINVGEERTNSARVLTTHYHSQHIQANTRPRFYSVCSPDDGHNDARNMLS